MLYFKLEGDMNATEFEAHVRKMADSHCQTKHRDHYESLICIGPNSQGFGSPCDECVREMRERLINKRAKAHGQELSAEEAEKVRKELGLD